MIAPLLATPRLYLDIDGVIISNNSPFETVNLNRFEAYAPEVVERLGRTGLELVWLSSWESEAHHISESIDALRKATVLPAGILDAPIRAKREALIADQKRAPSAFVWVDDMITYRTRMVVESRLRVPHLLISPNKERGLNDSELLRIEAFARHHQN